jgi:hypothetical protein
MPYSGMLRRVAVVGTDVLEERIDFIIKVNKNQQARNNFSSN